MGKIGNRGGLSELKALDAIGSHFQNVRNAGLGSCSLRLGLDLSCSDPSLGLSSLESWTSHFLFCLSFLDVLSHL